MIAHTLMMNEAVIKRISLIVSHKFLSVGNVCGSSSMIATEAMLARTTKARKRIAQIVASL